MADQIEIFNVQLKNIDVSVNRLTADLKVAKAAFKDAKPNTPEFEKYRLAVQSTNASIKLINDSTKAQANALGGVNQAAKFASGSYGELKQKIDAQKKSLLELNVESKEFAENQEELIKLEKQRIEIESKIPSLFKERIKGAIDESNALKNLRSELKAANAAALNGDGKAALRAAELRDQLEDLKDTTNSLKGSGVERLNTSVNLLSQGFADFDTDKIKTGFKGISAAMSAIPIVLLIEGVKALIDNFDAVVNFTKNLTGGFNAAAYSVKTLTAEVEKETIVNKGLIATYDNQIALLSAQGGHEKEITELKKKKIAVEIIEAENIVRLNAAKAAEVLINDSVGDSISRITIALLRKTGQDEAAEAQEKAINFDKRKRIKEELEAIQNAQIQIAAAKNAVLVLDAENAKKSNDKAKEKAKTDIEIAKEAQAREADILNAEIDREDAARKKSVENQKKANDMILELDNQLLASLQKNDEKLLQDKIANENINLINTQLQGGDLLNARLELLNAEREQELSNTELTQSQRALIINKYREYERNAELQTANEQLSSAANVTSSLGDLSDSLFQLKRSNLQKGSEEDKAAAKKQFDVNKAFGITTALIQGAVAVINASASVPYLPVGVAASIAATATTAATVAKIASTKFEYFDGGFTKQGDPTQKAESIGNAQFHNDEYVVPSKVKNNPAAIPHISMLEKMRQSTSKSFPKISGFFDGGYTARSVSSQSVSAANTQASVMDFIKSLPPQVLLISELNKVQNSNKSAVNVSGLG